MNCFLTSSQMVGLARQLTSFRHPLSLLDPGAQHFFCGDEKDSVPSLRTVHHPQLLYQEAGAALHMLTPYLKGSRHEYRHVMWEIIATAGPLDLQIRDQWI